MTDELIWALREKHRKGATVDDMAADYGMSTCTIALIVGDDWEYGARWDRETLAELMDMWERGVKIAAIASRFGVTPAAVKAVMYRNRELFPRRNAA